MALITSMLLIMFVSGMAQYHYEIKALHGVLQKQNKKTFNLLHSAIVEEVISEDIPILKSFIQLLVKEDDDLYSIRVENESGHPLVQWNRPGKTPVNRLLSYTRTVRLEDEVFGKLTAAWSTDRFFYEIKQQILHTLLYLSSVLLILTLLISLLIYRLVVIPIRKITDSLKFAVTGQNVELPEISSSYEMSKLNQSVNLLGTVLAEQNAKEKALRRAKDEIEKLSERNNLILHFAGEGIYGLDQNGLVVFANPAASRMLGWKEDELIGKTQLQLIENQKPEDESQSPGSFTICNAYQEGTTLESKKQVFLHKDGFSFPAEYTSAPIIKDSEVTGAVIVFKDISEKLKAEQQLRENEAIRKSMIESCMDAIIQMDEQGLITEFNQEAELMFGYPRESVIGKKLAELIIPDRYRESHQKGFDRFMATGESKIMHNRIEISALRANGEEFPVEISINFDRINNKIFFTAFISDITERQKAKHLIEHARDVAEKSNLAKSQFLAAMSHEIRTPLNAIVGIHDLLKTTMLNAEQKAYIEVAQEASITLRDVIGDILDFSKIEAGKIQLDIREVNPIHLLEKIMGMVQPKLIEKDLDLILQVKYPIPETVLFDPTHIQQVLINLVGNAIKFTERGWVKIGFSVFSNEAGLPFPYFEVFDTGIGIEAEKKQELFGEFVQADLSTTRKYGGTGLGLAISSRLVAMSGGKIGVESQPGKGTHFWFTAGSITKPLLSERKLSRLTCFILDNHKEHLKSLCEQIQYRTDQVIMLSSLRAMKPLRTTSLLFIDADLLANPDFDWEGYQQIRLENRAQLQTVVLTGKNKPQITTELTEKFDWKLRKPIRVTELNRLLDQVCGLEVIPSHSINGTVDTDSKELEGNGTGYKILLVEDGLANQMVIKTMLEKVNFTVDVAENGRIGLEMLQGTPYDLVLMDLAMPEMGGVEATERLRRSDSKNCKTPVLALTASTFIEDRQKCIEVGMNGFIAKPATMKSLLKEINACLKARPDSSILPGAVPTGKEHAENKEQWVNEKALEQLMDETSKEIFPDMVAVFIDEAAQRILNIEKAIEEGDFEKFRHEIHTLKSGSATFGAVKLAEMTWQIDQLCKNGKKQQAFEEGTYIPSCWKLTLEHLQKYMEN